VGDVRAKFRDTLPFAAAVPEERASESGPDCPKETRADSKEAIARINAMWPGVDELFVESFVRVPIPKVTERPKTTSTIQAKLNPTIAAIEASMFQQVREIYRPKDNIAKECSSAIGCSESDCSQRGDRHWRHPADARIGGTSVISGGERRAENSSRNNGRQEPDLCRGGGRPFGVGQGDGAG
jgi:hypothetical protein